jgi:pimeloyl-ACP methyl ester carboxylesterase
MEPSKVHIDSSDGKRIYAELHPTDGGADADPTPIVFIHGFLYSSSSFTPILSHLSARTRIIFDLEGRGKSTLESMTSWSLDSAVSTIVLVLSHFGYPPGTQVDVVAHSQGGISLAVLFSRSADPPTSYKVRRLVLMGPADPAEPPEMALAFAHQVRSQETDDLIVCLFSWLGAEAKSNQELISSISDKLYADVSYNRPFASRMIKAAVSAPGIWSARDSVDELWIVFGKEDGYFGWSVRTSVEKMKDVNTGHFFTWENAEATGKALQEILQPGS